MLERVNELNVPRLSRLTERYVDSILHALHAKEGFKEYIGACEDLLVRKFVWFEMPGAQGFD